MIPDPKEVISLAERIVQVEKELEALRSQWSQLFSVTVPKAPTGGKRDNSFPARVQAVVDAEPHKTFTIAEVADILQEKPLKVGRTLFRLSNTKHIESRGRGMYGAKQVIQSEAA